LNVYERCIPLGAILLETLLYLIMDNAGGQGTVEAWREFTQELKVRYNVKIICQIPQSPETNILNLGVQCSL
jgi:hypothetical protein